MSLKYEPTLEPLVPLVKTLPEVVAVLSVSGGGAQIMTLSELGADPS
jgi:hypothetical protein